MRLNRRPKVAAVPLIDMHPRDVIDLAHAGLITWEEVAEISRQRVIRQVGYDPYAHLRKEAGFDDEPAN